MYEGLFFISIINLAKYSERIPSEKKIKDATKSIRVIIKNWYLKTNNFRKVNAKYRTKIVKDEIKLIEESIVIKCSGLVLNEKIPFNPILNEPVNLLYLVSPISLLLRSNSITFCLKPI